MIVSVHAYLPVSEVVTGENIVWRNGKLSPLPVTRPSLEVSIPEPFTIHVTDTVTSTDGVRA